VAGPAGDQGGGRRHRRGGAVLALVAEGATTAPQPAPAGVPGHAASASRGRAWSPRCSNRSHCRTTSLAARCTSSATTKSASPPDSYRGARGRRKPRG